MTEVVVSVVIERPAADVFAYIADMSKNPLWQKGQRSCTWTSDQELDVGSTYDQEASFLGKTIRSSFEVTEFEDGRRIRIATTGGSMPIDVTREVREIDQGSCEVTATVRGDPTGMFKIAAPILDRMVRSNVRGDYQRLKELLETPE